MSFFFSKQHKLERVAVAGALVELTVWFRGDSDRWRAGPRALSIVSNHPENVCLLRLQAIQGDLQPGLWGVYWSFPATQTDVTLNGQLALTVNLIHLCVLTVCSADHRHFLVKCLRSKTIFLHCNESRSITITSVSEHYKVRFKIDLL